MDFLGLLMYLVSTYKLWRQVGLNKHIWHKGILSTFLSLSTIISQTKRSQRGELFSKIALSSRIEDSLGIYNWKEIRTSGVFYKISNFCWWTFVPHTFGLETFVPGYLMSTQLKKPFCSQDFCPRRLLFLRLLFTGLLIPGELLFSRILFPGGLLFPGLFFPDFCYQEDFCSPDFHSQEDLCCP
jgi:hypothetical protein